MKRVIATREGYFDNRIVSRGEEFYVPHDLEADWFYEVETTEVEDIDEPAPKRPVRKRPAKKRAAKEEPQAESSARPDEEVI